jgi:hypothetical protein
LALFNGFLRWEAWLMGGWRPARRECGFRIAAVVVDGRWWGGARIDLGKDWQALVQNMLEQELVNA